MSVKYNNAKKIIVSFKLHSFSDLITNSSNELFAIIGAKVHKEIEALVTHSIKKKLDELRVNSIDGGVYIENLTTEDLDNYPNLTKYGFNLDEQVVNLWLGYDDNVEIWKYALPKVLDEICGTDNYKLFLIDNL